MTRTMTDADRKYVERRREQAVWYAFGRGDEAEASSPARAVDPFAFGDYAAGQAELYRTEVIGMLPSVRAQWEQFVKDNA